MKYYFYRLMWHIAPFLPYGKIVHLDLELNNTCNQKCIMCWHSGEPPFEKHIMPLTNAYAWLRYYREKGALSVKFNLRGEPLLYKNLTKVVRYAKELGYVDIMINTNGQLLTGEKMRFLNEAGLTTCIVSFDSFLTETYEKIHNCSHAGYMNLHNNLERISEIEDLSCNVKLNYHINKLNEYEPRLEKYMGFPMVYRNTMKREGEDISIKKKRKRKRVCPHMMRRVTVLSNGTEYPCCVCYNEPEDIKIQSPYARKCLIRNYKNKKSDIVSVS